MRFTTALTIAAIAFAPAARAVETAAPTLLYWHLYADAQGVSHFKPVEMTFKAEPIAGLPKPPSAAAIEGANGATFLMLTPGQVEDWHRAPRTQFLVVVQGESEVIAGDGEVKRFKPGAVVLMDDTTGKGHITKAVGGLEHIALVIPVTKPK